MKRTSGRVGIGLVLVSMLVGACLADQEKGDELAQAMTRPQTANSDLRGVRDILLAVRGQLSRGFGVPNQTLQNTRATNGTLLSFDVRGSNTKPALEIFGSNGPASDMIKAGVDLSLPSTAAGSFRLREHSGGLTIDVGLEGATESAREDANGYVVYRGGYLNNAHIVHRPTADGTEDYVFFPDTLPQKSELRYHVALGADVAGLRLVGESLEMLDKAGTPRLRMAPPYAVDGDGQRLAIHVAIEGCAYDTSGAMPWGRATTNPGARECTVRLTWPENAKAPLVVDPVWAHSGNMANPRFNATSAGLPAAAGELRVIVVGGDQGSMNTVLATTEVYDDMTKTWGNGPAFANGAGVTEHGMAVINNNNTYALVVVGGHNAGGEFVNTGARLVLSTPNGPVSQPGWANIGGTMQSGRARPTVAAFENASKVFVAGGYGVENGTNNVPLKSIEIADLTGGWSGTTGSLTVARAGHALAQMIPTPSGLGFKGFLVGGLSGSGIISNSIERCEVAGSVITCSSTVSATNTTTYGTMKGGRVNHLAIYANQIVHVMGGDGLNTVECFNPNSGTWGQPTSTMSNNRSLFTANATPLVGGKYVIAGGDTATAGSPPNPMFPPSPTATVDIYDPAVQMFTPFASMIIPHSRHTAAVATDGRLFVMGGTTNGTVNAEILQECSSDTQCQDGSYCSRDGACVPTKKIGDTCDLTKDCWGGPCPNPDTRLCEGSGNCLNGICACSSDDECPDGTSGTPKTFCDKNGRCTPTKKLGDACDFNTDCFLNPDQPGCANPDRVCENSFCTDGVCCSSKCEGVCEVCNGTGLSEKAGKCSPVLGPPITNTPQMRPNCEGDGICGGRCDGFETKACTYPTGNLCEEGCNTTTNTAESKTCDGLGACSVVHSSPCSPYVCDPNSKQCGTTCTPAAPNMPEVGCDEKTAVCNVDKQCVSRPTSCVDDDTMQLPDGNTQPCFPFKCVDSACLTVCNTAYDCGVDPKDNTAYVCDDARRCVKPDVDQTVDIATSCSTAPANESSRHGWLAAIALAGAFVKRRNRARA